MRSLTSDLAPLGTGTEGKNKQSCNSRASDRCILDGTLSVLKRVHRKAPMLSPILTDKLTIGRFLLLLSSSLSLLPPR